jgi:hypothetical protein
MNRIICTIIVLAVVVLALAGAADAGHRQAATLTSLPGWTVPSFGAPPEPPVYGRPQLSFAEYDPHGEFCGVDLFWWLRK